MLQSSRDVDKFARTKKRNILIQSPGALNAILILASSQGEASGKTNLVDLYFSLPPAICLTPTQGAKKIIRDQSK